MTDLVLDVWNDLREKRLVPVAAALLLALIVVPIALGRGSGDDGPPSVPAPQQPAAKHGPTVGAVGEPPSSDLGVFNSKDPFRPAVKNSGSDGGGGDGQAQVVTPGPSGGGSAGAPAGAGLLGGGSPSGGGSTPEAPTSPTAPTPNTQAPSKPRSKLYTYVVDLNFGRSGRERRRKGVKRLAILPNERRPLLVFLGVTADTRRAVFLADSTVSQSGEGRCRPDVDTCTFIYLSLDEERNQHFITDAEGREYSLELLRIRALEVEPKKASKSSRASRKRRAAAARRRQRERERQGHKTTVFQLPLFADSRR